MKEIIKKLQQLYIDNSSFIKFLTLAALADGEIMNEVIQMELETKF